MSEEKKEYERDDGSEEIDEDSDEERIYRVSLILRGNNYLNKEGIEHFFEGSLEQATDRSGGASMEDLKIEKVKEKPPFDLMAAVRQYAVEEAKNHNPEIQEALDKGWTITADDLPDSEEIYERYMDASNPADHIMDLLEGDGLSDESDTEEYFGDCCRAGMIYGMATSWLWEQDHPDDE